MWYCGCQFRRIYWLKSTGLVQRSAVTRRCVLHSSDEPSELWQWQCHDDSTVNIVVHRYYYYDYDTDASDAGVVVAVTMTTTLMLMMLMLLLLLL